MLYSAGPCSVCGEMSEAFLVQDIKSKRIFFACPACGIGWSKPPQIGHVDTIDPISVFAPTGIVFPTQEAIRLAGLEELVVKQLDDSWRSLFEKDLPGSVN